jgi:Na+-transporting methylmalonyl-CoA/oxaloacetate decarboxylase gamma subunit
MIELFNAALLVNQRVMRELRESPFVVQRGLAIVLFVGLLVGVVTGVSQLVNTATPERTVDEVREAVDAYVAQLTVGANSEQAQPIIQQINRNEEAVYALLIELLTLPTPLPRPVGQLFQLLASIVSTPLSYLAGLLVAVVFTHIAARQLGGQGSIQQMLGLGALSVAPHALDALAIIPVLGGTLTFIAWAWGLVVLVVATMVAHKLDSGRATMAVLLYPLVGMLLGLLALCGLFLLGVGLAASGV